MGVTSKSALVVVKAEGQEAGAEEVGRALRAQGRRGPGAPAGLTRREASGQGSSVVNAIETLMTAFLTGPNAGRAGGTGWRKGKRRREDG